MWRPRELQRVVRSCTSQSVIEVEARVEEEEEVEVYLEQCSRSVGAAEPFTPVHPPAASQQMQAIFLLNGLQLCGAFAEC